jgi:hypothetical protein
VLGLMIYFNDQLGINEMKIVNRPFFYWWRPAIRFPNLVFDPYFAYVIQYSNIGIRSWIRTIYIILRR